MCMSFCWAVLGSGYRVWMCFCQRGRVWMMLGMGFSLVGKPIVSRVLAQGSRATCVPCRCLSKYQYCDSRLFLQIWYRGPQIDFYLESGSFKSEIVGLILKLQLCKKGCAHLVLFGIWLTDSTWRVRGT